MITLSVIVPVYNVRSYLKRCLDSILNQKLKDIEIILINDGSTDGSDNLCNEYALKERKIKVIHQKNKGLSEARNKGIELAKGKYITFIDSDDFITKDGLQRMVTEGEKNNADIVAGYGLIYVNENNKKPKIKKRQMESKVYSGTDFLVESLKQEAMSMCATLNLYDREFLFNTELKFKPGIYHEDELWTPQVFLKAKKVICVDTDYYMHFTREGSITQTIDKTKHGLDLINICYELDSLFMNVKNRTQREVLLNNLVTLYLNGFFVGRLYKKEYEGNLNSSFVMERAYTKKNFLKVCLFKMNKHLYYYVNFYFKKTLSMVG